MRRGEWWTRALPAALLLALATAVFLPVAGFGLVEYDDPAFIRDNPHVNRGVTVEGLRWAVIPGAEDIQLRPGVGNLWHPLAWVSHMVDFEVWGRWWGGHHLTSLALHLLATLLVLRLGFRLTGSPSAGCLAAALFAVHPLHVESVAWLSDRKGVLSGCLALAALVAWTEGAAAGKRGWRWMAFPCYVAAALAKPTAVVVPLLVVLVDWFRGHPAGLSMGSALRFHLREKAPWLLIAAGVAGITLMTQAGGTHGGGAPPWWDRLLLLAANFFSYLGRTLWPADLAMHYPRPGWAVPGALAALWIAFLALPMLLWSWRRHFRAGFLAWGWMTACWLPVSGLAYVGTSFVADRYTYLMLVGPFLAAAAGWSAWRRVHPWPARAVSILLVGALALLAARQVRVWRSTESLYTHAFAAQPTDRIVVQNYAAMLLQAGRPAEARQTLEGAMSRFPRDAQPAYNLGLCLRRLGDESGAREAYRETLRRDPSHFAARLNLGLLLGSTDEAGDHLRQACELSGYRNAAAVLALVRFHLDRGEGSEAAEIVRRTRDLQAADPEHARLLRQLRRQLPTSGIPNNQ